MSHNAEPPGENSAARPTYSAGGTGEDPAVFRVLMEIGLIDQRATAVLERALRHDMSLAQFVVLHQLARFGGKWNPLRLSHALHVSKGAMTNTLKKLEARSLIAVAPDPSDGRGKIVHLTQAGLKARNSAIAKAAPVMRAMIQTFGEERFAAALPFLSELRAWLVSTRQSDKLSGDVAES